jgi:hypothetical protein
MVAEEEVEEAESREQASGANQNKSKKAVDEIR